MYIQYYKKKDIKEYFIYNCNKYILYTLIHLSSILYNNKNLAYKLQLITFPGGHKWTVYSTEFWLWAIIKCFCTSLGLKLRQCFHRFYFNFLRALSHFGSQVF